MIPPGVTVIPLPPGIITINEDTATRAVALLWCLYAAGHIPHKHAGQARDNAVEQYRKERRQ